MRRIISLFLVMMFLASVSYAKDFVFKKGRSSYSIVLADNASETMQTAAAELQGYLRKVSGITLPITTQTTSPGIYLQHLPEEGEFYHYYREGNNIFIAGARERGLLYGVYAFLEQELGIRWLTPTDTYIPEIKKYPLHNFDVSSRPAFPYRMIYTYDALSDNEWCAHNGTNVQAVAVKNKYGDMESWWGMHTFGQLVPANTYFATHPEYFSLYEGKRINDGQLCLTNEHLLTTLVNALIKKIQQNPDAWVYDVSQNDNLKYCQCEKCEALAEKYGGQGGLMIWFVNQVAARVKASYPNKMIGTFAYRYTRDVPRGIRPASNVAVRLCSFECCFAHQLDACERNQSFTSDMAGWKKLTSNLYVYDYCVGFAQYLAPLPYFRPLADRLRSFKQAGVKGVLELGAYDARWSDFSEMKNWVLAKLLWNPAQDVDSLAKIFIDRYYGKAAKPVYEYYLLTQDIPQPDTHFTIYCDYKNSAFTSQYRSKALQLAEKALKAARRDSILQQRVNRVVAQALFLQVMHNPITSRFDGTLKRLKDIISKDPTYAMERRMTLDDLLKHWQDI